MKKRVLSVILCMVILLTVFMSAPITASAFAYDFEVDGIRYAHIDDNSVEVAGYNSSVLPVDLVVPSTVEGKTVTGIRHLGFDGAKIRSVVLPETVTVIDRYGFSYCKELETFTSLGGLTYIDTYAFQSCFKLKELNLPDSLENIGSSAFNGCKSLSSIKFPKGLESIGNHAFQGCIFLEEITINSQLQILGDSAFAGITALKNVIFEERTTPITIGYRTFNNCTGLTDFDFSCVGLIDTEGFANCTGFTSIVIPEESNIKMYSGTFMDCTNIKTVKFPSYITEIPDSCFANCTSLESIETGNITGIGGSAFYNCTSLRDISFATDNNISWVGREAFYNCELLTEISLHNAKSVHDSAFENCYNLSKVTFGENLKDIGEKAFYNCYYLTEVSLFNVGYVDSQAFENCYSLSSVTLKEGVKAIEERAFFNCFSLYEIYIPKTVELIGSMALGCFEEEGQYYIYTDFTVLGDPESLAPKYAEAYEMQYALPDVQLSSISNTSDGIKITFEKLSGVSGYYRVYRKTADTSWSKLTDVTTASYTDKTAVAGVYYTYTVKFIGYDGTESRYDKNGLSITRLVTPKVTKIQNTEKGAKFTIEKVEGAAYYRVFYKTSDGWKGIDNTDTTTFVHEGAKSGESYTYTVKAFDQFENSSSFNSTGWSNTFVATPQITSVTSTEKGVKITWDKIDGAVNYRVYYKNGSDWKGIGNTTSTTFTHTDATPGVKYTYTVRCMKSDGKTAVSDYSKQGKSHTYFYKGSMESMHKAMQKIKSNSGVTEPAQKSSSALKPQAAKSALVSAMKQVTQQLSSKFKSFAKR